MRAVVLGAAAGGGAPQWNCACRVCASLRDGQGRPSTQASLAVSADGERWWLLGASPDLGTQLARTPALWPRPPRSTPVVGVVLPDAELDSTMGLFALREAPHLVVAATRPVREALMANPMLRTFDRPGSRLVWCDLEADRPTSLVDALGRPSGLTVTAVPVPGKRPIHLGAEGEHPPDLHVGLVVQDGAERLAYFPSVAGPSPSVDQAVREATVVLWDGTFWRDDELVAMGGRAASAMAHWPLGGSGGSLAYLASLPARRRLVVHVNNTNPVHLPGSPERRALDDAGIQLPHDGQELLP